MKNLPFAVLSGNLKIRLTEKQLASLLQQWKRDGKPGDTITLQLLQR